MLASPPPSLPASFPHMVLIRSGLRDSSQRKWLCTESFCKGRRGEGERLKRKKERKREEAEVGGGRSRRRTPLPSNGAKSQLPHSMWGPRLCLSEAGNPEEVHIPR